MRPDPVFHLGLRVVGVVVEVVEVSLTTSLPKPFALAAFKTIIRPSLMLGYSWRKHQRLCLAGLPCFSDMLFHIFQTAGYKSIVVLPGTGARASANCI